jgi:hypothetical protein
VIAIPDRRFPPTADVLSRASLVLSGLDDLTIDAVERADARSRARIEKRLDEEEDESFPASDPHADWAGPPP